MSNLAFCIDSTDGATKPIRTLSIFHTRDQRLYGFMLKWQKCHLHRTVYSHVRCALSLRTAELRVVSMFVLAAGEDGVRIQVQAACSDVAADFSRTLRRRHRSQSSVETDY